MPQEQPLTHLDPAAFAAVWKKREERCAVAKAAAMTLTPTSSRRLGVSEFGGDEWTPKRQDAETPIQSSTLLGTLVHQFLEQWDFAAEKCAMPAKLHHVANAFLAAQGLLKEPFPDPKVGGVTQNPAALVSMVEEAQDLLAGFIGSDAWEEIRTSKILGREIPFYYPVEGAMMRGTMDILYRLPGGELIIGDYKTGRPQNPDAFAAQAHAYETAVSTTLGERARFKPLYLRLT